MITFPTTTEAFIAFQEAGTGRKLEGFERDLADIVVELINISYQEGAEGRTHTVSMDGVEGRLPRGCARRRRPTNWPGYGKVSAGGVIKHTRPGRRSPSMNEEMTAAEAEYILSQIMEIFMTLPPDQQVDLYYRLEQVQKEEAAQNEPDCNP